MDVLETFKQDSLAGLNVKKIALPMKLGGHHSRSETDISANWPASWPSSRPPPPKPQKLFLLFLGGLLAGVLLTGLLIGKLDHRPRAPASVVGVYVKNDASRSEASVVIRKEGVVDSVTVSSSGVQARVEPPAPTSDVAVDERLNGAVESLDKVASTFIEDAEAVIEDPRTQGAALLARDRARASLQPTVLSLPMTWPRTGLFSGQLSGSTCTAGRSFRLPPPPTSDGLYGACFSAWQAGYGATYAEMDMLGARVQGCATIALLFISRGPLPHDGLWQRWIDNAKGLFTVYVHAPTGFVYNASTTAAPAFYGRQVTNSTKVEWGQMSVVDAERRLLRAALSDASNQRFVLLSESCVPLRSAAYVYRYLLASPYSFLDSFNDVQGRYNPAMAPIIPHTTWRKGTQWFALVRAHAELVAADAEVYSEFAKHCKVEWRVQGQSFSRFCAPDEHYKQTLMAKLGLEDELMRRPVTFAEWWPVTRWHPKMYAVQETTRELIQDLQARTWHWRPLERQAYSCGGEVPGSGMPHDVGCADKFISVDAVNPPAWRHGGPVIPWRPWRPPIDHAGSKFDAAVAAAALSDSGGHPGNTSTARAKDHTSTGPRRGAGKKRQAGADQEWQRPCWLFARKFTAKAGKRLARMATLLLNESAY